jgi:Protein of unknown function (DUF3102)
MTSTNAIARAAQVGDNSLADLAARIRAEHEATSDALRSGVAHAMAAGDLLIEAKALVKHGEWLPWLRDHCAISERTAQLYMRCARSRKEIEANTQSFADLNLNEAAALLALSSDVRKLLDFARKLERLTDPEEIMQLCLDSGVADMGTRDYESDYTAEQRREWDLYILFRVRHTRCRASDADDHVCWLKRRGYKTPSEWMDDADGWRRRQGRHIAEPLKQQWRDLLAQTANLDRVAINKLIGEEDKALQAEIAASPGVPEK